MQKFYVGAKALCVKTHSQGLVTKGKVYEVQGVTSFPCKCKPIVLDLGLKSTGKHKKCSCCGTRLRFQDDVLLLHSKIFVLLDPDNQLSEVDANAILDLMLHEDNY